MTVAICATPLAGVVAAMAVAAAMVLLVTDVVTAAVMVAMAMATRMIAVLVWCRWPGGRRDGDEARLHRSLDGYLELAYKKSSGRLH